MTSTPNFEGSFTVFIANLEPDITAAYVYRMIEPYIPGKILEIVCDGAQEAYVTFKDKEAAEAAIELYDNKHSDAKYHRLRASMAHGYVPKDTKYSLTAWMEEQKQYETVKSRTVRVAGLNRTHTRRSIDQLLDEYFANDWEEHEVAVDQGDFGVAYVQFADNATALSFSKLYNASFWKFGVIDVHRVGDDVFEEHVVRKSGGKQVGYWVGNLKPDITSEEISKMFQPFPLQDVNIPASKNNGPPFAFVFMKQDDAAGFNALHPKGFKYQGRWIKVRPMKGKGNATAAPIPQPSEASIAASASADTHEAAPKENNEIAKKAPLPDGPTDVRVDNIAYSAKKTDLRDFFKGFDVTKVVLKKGYSFVGFNSLKDAQSAATRLGGKKMLGRSVSVKVNGPPPTHG